MSIDIIKDKIQKEIIESLPVPAIGLLQLAPRVGKTKIAIDIVKKEKSESILWLTNSTELRDTDIPKEFKEWDAEEYLGKTSIICYSSLGKKTGKFDKIILDEYQCLTPINAAPLLDGRIQYNSIIGLSGTHPKHKEKLELYEKLGLKVIKTLSIDEAITLGLIAPYNITTVGCDIEKVNKTVLAGNQFNPFYVTELQKYIYLTNLIEAGNIKDCLKYNLEGFQMFYKDTVLKLKEFVPKFECDKAFYILLETEVNGKLDVQRLGYLVLKKEVLRGKLRVGNTEYRIFDKDLVSVASKYLYINRANLIYSIKSKYTIAKKLISQLKGRTLIFSGSIEMAEFLSPYTYHSKTDNKYLKAFIEGGIPLLSCVNAGGTGFTYENVDNFVIIQVNSNRRGDITQKVCRSLMLQPDYTANIYILYVKDTVDQEWKDKVLESFNKIRITEISVNDLLTRT